MRRRARDSSSACTSSARRPSRRWRRPGDGVVRRFLDKRGPGLHHIAFEVDAIDAALVDLDRARRAAHRSRGACGRDGNADRLPPSRRRSAACWWSSSRKRPRANGIRSERERTDGRPEPRDGTTDASPVFTARPDRRKMTDWVWEEMREAIIELRLRPGEPLREVALAEQLGVSKTPLREAFARLEQEGLVETTSFKGAVVTGYSERDLKEIYELRALLEGAAARAAAERSTDETLQRAARPGRPQPRRFATRATSSGWRGCLEQFDLLVYAQVSERYGSAALDREPSGPSHAGSASSPRASPGGSRHPSRSTPRSSTRSRARPRRGGAVDAGAHRERAGRPAGDAREPRTRGSVSDGGTNRRRRRLDPARAGRGRVGGGDPASDGAGHRRRDRSRTRRSGGTSRRTSCTSRSTRGRSASSSGRRRTGTRVTILTRFLAQIVEERDPREPRLPRPARWRPRHGRRPGQDAAGHLRVHAAPLVGLRARRLRGRAHRRAAVPMELWGAGATANRAPTGRPDLRRLDRHVRQRRLRRARSPRRRRCSIVSSTRRTSTGCRSSRGSSSGPPGTRRTFWDMAYGDTTAGSDRGRRRDVDACGADPRRPVAACGRDRRPADRTPVRCSSGPTRPACAGPISTSSMA